MTVYGDLVYKAARMMTSNQGTVSCDAVTKLYSMLPLSQLFPQRTISLDEQVQCREEITELYVPSFFHFFVVCTYFSIVNESICMAYITGLFTKI